jgi:hypothetical protein
MIAFYYYYFALIMGGGDYASNKKGVFLSVLLGLSYLSNPTG